MTHIKFEEGLKTFVENNSIIYEQMIETTHTMFSEDKSKLNPYHIEHNVWTHTMMVCSHCHSGLAKVAGFFHDIGKIFTAKKSPKGNTAFTGHESKSVFEIIRYKEQIKKHWGLSDAQIKSIMTAVGLHGRFWGWKENDVIEAIQHLDYDTQVILLDLLVADQKGRFAVAGGEAPCFDGVIVQSSVNRNPNAPKVYVMIGLPGSGKSTYINTLIESGEVKPENIISRDDVLMEMVAEHAGKDMTYREAWIYADENELHKLIDQKVAQKVQQVSNSRENAVIDMVNMTKSARKKRVNPFTSKGYTAHAVFVATDPTICIVRRSGDKYVPQDVIYGLEEKLTIPLYDEVDSFEIVFNDEVK